MMNNIKLSAVLQLNAEYKKMQHKPSNWILDKIADETINAGYNKRNAMCTKCFTKASVNGMCLCNS